MFYRWYLWHFVEYICSKNKTRAKNHALVIGFKTPFNTIRIWIKKIILYDRRYLSKTFKRHTTHKNIDFYPYPVMCAISLIYRSVWFIDYIHTTQYMKNYFCFKINIVEENAHPAIVVHCKFSKWIFFIVSAIDL